MVTDAAPTHDWPEAEAEQRPRRRKRWYVIAAAAVLIGVYLMFFVALASTYTIPSSTMEPSYPVGTRVWATRFGSVERGIVVIAENSSREPGDPELVIGRVVAIGGDEVSARDGKLIVNGEPVDESYLAPGTQTVMNEVVEVPSGAIFLAGDNRENSFDSRFKGPQPESTIVGWVRLSI